MNIEHLLQYENSRQVAYQLLATFYSLPENGIIKKLTKLEKVLERLAPRGVENIAPMKSNLRIEPLEVDYAALFVGPFKLLAPPYGSIYLESNQRIMGDSTIDASNRYRESGLQVASNFKEAPDHIVIELEFMSFLIFKEIEALKKNDIEEALACLGTQNNFLRDHLGAWVSKFTKNVKENAQTSFYRNLASVTKLFVKNDYTNITDVSVATLRSLVVVA
ncbi:MAG: Tat proofreading chaperone DmsD [Chloroflexi bacterium]|nr:Tat proofreading chaperone DmsD [Chloroflexota bacterium]